MQNKLVSILIPFKNTEAFIADCIESILQQTYKNWELIIVDNNSIDKSHNIVNAFADKDSRIKLLKNSRTGIITALQLAFSKSKGELITRMDSDDIMPPNKLKVLVNNLVTHGNKHISIGLVNYFSEEGIKNGYKNYEFWLNNLTQTGANYSEIYKECVIPSPCWMIHRDDLIACDAFNTNRYPEDYDLAFRFYKHQYKCIPCNQVLHNWRDYNTRTSRTHVHYTENHIIPLKLDYFLELDYNTGKTLVLWGAGNKGKTIAKILIEKNVSFTWICDNPNKIGRDIYGKILKPFDDLEKISNPQSIITVANKSSQKEIKNYMLKLDMKPIEDYIFFC
ncbi:Glycosyltransferase involved in cell wall bisynthesis [Flaviramulus basaltis]|uniref:Glycosyltransferase involved in cell wall bisynthesis n=1 Tax=Flaviramulus basaltis TaxID=369401 RepID=A0A1K2II76_9FLAO|nr:glycosyltransferase family 2 protein [Flaviramulus basaltis]SFZ92132.1 Glycosyltransferase involved in cell wall bisynthesis [Flaviramulus basaltis]